ncbi:MULTISPECIES: hypothetical protein [Asaia]|uniref:hypothetical protein n=1 Tax=Asaia TaxID=91914 RepID=UPI00255402D8|nr:hypothetical protein [Asaia sp. HumB]MDL2170070.1 hypothetical protein [Asaia sp. HumB]
MSLFDLSLFILAIGLWASIFIVRFRHNIREWYDNRYGRATPPTPADFDVSKVALPFKYTGAEAKNSDTDPSIPENAPKHSD